MGQSFGDRLREARLARGWTQEQVAERSGVPQVTISAIERAHRPNPTLETAAALARALGMSLDELAGLDDGAERRSREAAVERLRQDLDAMVHLVDQIAPR